MLELFKLAGDMYFRPKNFEADGKIYEKMGIKIFRKLILTNYSLLLKSGIVKIEPNNNYFLTNYSLEGIKKFDADQTRKNEMLHMPFLISSSLALVGDPSSTACWAAVTLNLYCILLQRYNRARIYKVLNTQRALTKQRKVEDRQMPVQKISDIKEVGYSL